MPAARPPRRVLIVSACTALAFAAIASAWCAGWISQSCRDSAQNFASAWSQGWIPAVIEPPVHVADAVQEHIAPDSNNDAVALPSPKRRFPSDLDSGVDQEQTEPDFEPVTPAGFERPTAKRSSRNTNFKSLPEALEPEALEPEPADHSGGQFEPDTVDPASSAQDSTRHQAVPIEDEPVETLTKKDEDVPVIDEPIKPPAEKPTSEKPAVGKTPIVKTPIKPIKKSSGAETGTVEQPSEKGASGPSKDSAEIPSGKNRAKGLDGPLAPISDIEDKASQARALHGFVELEKLIEQGDLPTALAEYSRWYWRVPEQRAEIQTRLDELAEQVYFSPRPHFHEPYVVQPGDQLRSIARKYSLPWEYLARLNKVDAKKIRAGQKLKVIDGPLSAYVCLSNYELIVHHRGVYVRRFRVGVGKSGSTPVGTFPVKEKLVDPTYYGDEGVIAHDDPKNPLGERWIDIGDSFGLHGTIDPASIGKNESRGCIRLLNEDVAELYDLLSIGSTVTIQK